MSSGQPPPPEPQGDGVSQGQNSSGNNEVETGSVELGEEKWRGKDEIFLRKGRRARRARFKRGMRSSCGRARRWRNRLANLTNRGMSPEEVLDTLQRREDGERVYSNADLEEMREKNAEEKREMQSEEAKTRERRTVMNTKVDTYGTWRRDEKEAEDVTFLGVNINSLSYWSKSSNKAARLRYIVQEYGVDSVGLQEVCVNWAKLPPSKSLAEALREKVETIRSIASHNKAEEKQKVWVRPNEGARRW